MRAYVENPRGYSCTWLCALLPGLRTCWLFSVVWNVALQIFLELLTLSFNLLQALHLSAFMMFLLHHEP